jgi:histidine ammonia-lyase
MATTAARDTLRIVALTEQVAAIATLAACQGLDLRGGAARDTAVDRLRAAVREHVPGVTEDRRMDHDIQTVLRLMRADALPLGAAELPA